MATTDEIRRKLQEQATQRVNPLLKGLSMLTGGIAGEFTGTNEQIRQQRQARRALMEENLAALQEERMMERMKAQQDEMLKRQLQIEEAQRLAALDIETRKAQGSEMVLTGADKTAVGPFDRATLAGMATARAQRALTTERDAAEKSRLIGQLVAEMGPTERAAVESGVVPSYETMDIGTLRKMASASEAARSIAKEARQIKREEGVKMQLVTPSGSVVYGSYDELASKYPALVENITVAKSKEAKPLDAGFTESDGQISFRFGPGVTPEQAAEYKKSVYKSFGIDFGEGAGKPGAGAGLPLKGPSAEKGAPQVGRGTGTARGGAAASVASEMAASTTPDMYGPLSPREQFVQTGRRLGALEGRGGTSTYGAQQTLTNPFYEAVAQELGTQPQRVGSESVLVKGAKAVIASEFPTEQWNKLPQEIQNRIYIEALNKSAAEMAKPPQQKGVFGMGYAESPFASYSFKRD